MPFTVTININRTLKTAASLEKVFELLSNVARSGSFFPKVEKLIDLGNNTWRWEMERIGIGEHTLQQSIYACKYTFDKDRQTVAWTPVEGIGNAIVEGKWDVTPMHEGCKAALQSKGIVTVSLPGFLDFLLSPLIRMEFESIVDQYIANLEKEFARNQANP